MAWLAILFFAIAAVLSGFFVNKVRINYNLADYLDKDTQTKIAMNIIEDEFGMTGNIQVMVSNVDEEKAEEISEKIEAVDHVINVNFDRYDTNYYNDNIALYVVIIDGDDYSDNAKSVYDDLKLVLAPYEGTEYGGTTVEKLKLRDSITGEMGYILGISLCLVIAILLLTSESWIEPLILLAASGVAILINKGTNVFFGEISYITNSISAILQLALSIDYSIVLLHAYRKEKANCEDSKTAMKKAIKSVISPVSASALTTIAGLLALLFMSFRIGFDIGTVLMKGIVISAITSLTLLPALILLFDKPMRKLHKKPLKPKGRIFTKNATKVGWLIVPLALALIGGSGYLQAKNNYLFSDTKAGNEKITEAFGNNNTVIVVYQNAEDSDEKEKKLIADLKNYRTSDGKAVLTTYTAYTNTVKEEYDVTKATRKLNLSKEDTELLYTMYHLYQNPDSAKMTFRDFINVADDIATNDSSVEDFVDQETKDTIKTLKTASEITESDLTAEELYGRLNSGMSISTDISLFSLRQLYGLYYYEGLEEKNIDFRTMLSFIRKARENEEVKTMIPEETAKQIEQLSAGIAQFLAQMDLEMDKATFRAYFYQNYQVLLTEEQVNYIYRGYFLSKQETPKDTIPFLNLMNYLVETSMITDQTAVATISQYSILYAIIKSSYPYEQFLPVLKQVAEALTGSQVEMGASSDSIRQLYILYFYGNGTMKTGAINGKTFFEYVLAQSEKDSAIQSQLTEENRKKIEDMLTISKFNEDTKKKNYQELYQTMLSLKNSLKSDVKFSEIEEEKISGVYIKKLVNDNSSLSDPIMAYQLLDFIDDNKDSNSLLKTKMTAENRKKVDDAKNDIKKANDLFVGENYSRMLLSVDLPNEGTDVTDFVSHLSNQTKEIFGEGSYITGEIVSAYDLQKSFDHDNLFITIFTLISIFVIVMVVFRSLSLPTILVCIIEGAIFIAMSTQFLAGNSIFFMSYIVTICILMGATIDYGILMSSNYVNFRSRFSKKKSLEMAVESAMPTIFTSGLILTVCGFVIHFISSQNSISTVGLLLGIGTICSAVMITVVLPSVLYLMDGFVMKLSLRKRTNNGIIDVMDSQETDLR